MPATILPNLTAPILDEDLSSFTQKHDDLIRILQVLKSVSYCTMTTAIVVLFLVAAALLWYFRCRRFQPSPAINQPEADDEVIDSGRTSWYGRATPTHTDAIYPQPLRRPYGPPPSTTRSWDCHPSPTEAIAVQTEYPSPTEAVTIQPDAESWGSGSKTWGSHAE